MFCPLPQTRRAHLGSEWAELGFWWIEAGKQVPAVPPTQQTFQACQSPLPTVVSWFCGFRSRLPCPSVGGVVGGPGPLASCHCDLELTLTPTSRFIEAFSSLPVPIPDLVPCCPGCVQLLFLHFSVPTLGRQQRAASQTAASPRQPFG